MQYGGAIYANACFRLGSTHLYQFLFFITARILAE